MSDPYPFLPNGDRRTLVRRIEEDLRRLNATRIIINGREQYLNDITNGDILKLRWDVKKLDSYLVGVPEERKSIPIPILLLIAYFLFQ